MLSRKLLGTIFLAAAVLGTLISLFGIIQIWRARASAEQIAENAFEVTTRTLEATEDGLSVIDDLVLTTSEEVTLLETTIQTLTKTIDETDSILTSLTALTGEDLPAALGATQTSLASAQTSAVLIDDFLGALAGIPLLRLGTYQPDVPLSTALGDISDSLDPLGPTLESIRTSLDGTATNLTAVQGDLDAFIATTGEIKQALEDAGSVIADYQEIVADLSIRLDSMQRAAPANIRAGAWISTLILFAILFPQLGLAERGLSLLREESDESL